MHDALLVCTRLPGALDSYRDRITPYSSECNQVIVVQLANYPGDSLVYHAYMEIWTPVVGEIYAGLWSGSPMCLPSIVTFSMIIGFLIFYLLGVVGRAQ